MFSRIKRVSIVLAVAALVVMGCTPTPAPATPTVSPTSTTAPATEAPATEAPATETPTTETPTAVPPTQTAESPIPTPESPLATPTLTTPISPTAAADASGATAGALPEIIVNAQKLQMASGAFRAVMKIDTGLGTTLENTVEYQLPDRVHMITPAGEFIAIRGQGTWQKNGATWEKSQLDMGAAIFDNLDPQALEELRKDLDVKQGAVKDMGTETLNGKEARVYQYESSVNTGGVPMGATTKLWIDASTNLPMQSVIESDPVAEGGAKTTTTITYTYDPTIKIEAPQE